MNESLTQFPVDRDKGCYQHNIKGKNTIGPKSMLCFSSCEALFTGIYSEYHHKNLKTKNLGECFQWRVYIIFFKRSNLLVRCCRFCITGVSFFLTFKKNKKSESHVISFSLNVDLHFERQSITQFLTIQWVDSIKVINSR